MLVPWLLAPTWTFKIYLLTVLVTSPISFALFGVDERRSRTGGTGIPERTLLIVAFVGGWPGAWLGWRLFETQRRTYRVRLLFWSIIGDHLSFVFMALVFLRVPG